MWRFHVAALHLTPMFGSKWSQCDVFIFPTSPSLPRDQTTFQSLPARPLLYSAMPKIGAPTWCHLAQGQFLHNFIHERGLEIHKLTFILPDNPSLWDFKVRGAIRSDVPSDLLFITFDIISAISSIGESIDAAIHVSPIYSSGKERDPPVSHDKCIEAVSNFEHICIYFSILWLLLTFLVGYCLEPGVFECIYQMYNRALEE